MPPPRSGWQKKCENIAGIKEASGDMAQCMEILRDKPEGFLVVSGDDALALAADRLRNGRGYQRGRQRLSRRIQSDGPPFVKGDFKAAKAINDRLIAAYELMFGENNPAGVKGAMAEMGLIGNYLRLPVVPLSAGLQARWATYLGKK